MTNRKIILYIILLIVLSAASYTILVVVPTQLVQRSYDGARQIGRDIQEAFGFTPQITVNNTIVLQQQIPILELATVSQKFQHQFQWTNTWLGSTKEIKITATLEAKAGFNLNKKFSISIEDNKATVTMPMPQLLSLEPMGDYTFEDESGIWNWVDNEDRAGAVNAFQQDARKYAAQAPFVADAQRTMENRLREILQNHVEVVQFRYDGDHPNVRIE